MMIRICDNGELSMNRPYQNEAAQFINAIENIANKPTNLENLESYLSMHFQAWLEKYANTPENITSEMRLFAEMDV